MTAARNRKRLVAAFEDLARARAELAAALEMVEDQNRRFIEHLEGGRPLSEVYDDGLTIERRNAMFGVLASFDRAFSRARVEAARIMIDDEGLSLSEVARLIGRSRQFVTRLYRSAPSPEDGRRRAEGSNGRARRSTRGLS